MKIPFVSFIPMEKELDSDLRAAFERVYTRSWYIEGVEDEAFEKPDWIGEEVSGDPRYFNSNLVAHTYSKWEI